MRPANKQAATYNESDTFSTFTKPMHSNAASPSTVDRVDSAALTQLLGLFALETVETDHYIGQSLDLGYRNLFGGHILGQALMAAGNTCEQRNAHSLHAYFLRGGDPRAPIHYNVDRIRDGNSFSVRRVTASQGGKAILILSSSFQVDEDGLEHQIAMPDVPPPEALAPMGNTARPVPELIPTETQNQAAPELAIEMRPVDPVDLVHPQKKDPVQHVWFRAAGRVPNQPALQKCLLAYASDFGLLSTSMRPHGVTYYQPDMVTASLDHAMWFYRDFQIDDWMLYVCDSPSAGHARGVNRGSIFSRDGRLIACVAQEGLIRQVR